jgi:hypothetical protein
MWVTPRWLGILRDLVCLAAGITGIMHQEFSGQASPLLLAVYTSLLGIPGAANALAILRGTGGGSPPSSSRSPAPSAELPSSSTPAADD